MSSQPEETQPAEVSTEQTLQESAKELVISDTPTLTTFRASADILKFPRHILTRKSRGKKQDRIQIGERKKDQPYWIVTFNPEYGVSGKTGFDFTNRVLLPRIYEESLKAQKNGQKEISRFLSLDYITNICKQIGRGTSGRDLMQVKAAIQADATAAIECNAVIRTSKDGGVEYLTGVFTVFEAYFRGSKLPNGTEVEKVFVALSEPFRKAASSPEFFKPVNLEYLKQLNNGGAERWYIYVSTLIFTAIKYNQVARVRYSEYCKFHPQKRHKTFSQMKRQMNNLHQKHVEFEYIEPPQYQETRDANDQKDWWILYKPWTKARAEYQQNRQRRIPKSVPKELSQETDVSQDAYNLVAYFQKQKNNQDMYSPTAKELKQAAELSSKHGIERAKRIVGLAINEMAKTNFNAIYFGAVLQYENQTLETLELKEQQDQQTRENQKAEHEAQVKQYQDWHKLTPEERIKAKLDFKIFGHQLKHKRPPDETQIKQWQQELTETIPTPEEYQMQLFGRIIFPI